MWARREASDSRREAAALTKEQMKAAGLYGLFGEAYSLLQTHAGQQAIDWQAVTDEANRICKERDGTDLEELAGRLCFDIVDYLDKTSKGPAACPAMDGTDHRRP